MSLKQKNEVDSCNKPKFYIEKGNWGSLFHVACAQGNLAIVKGFVEQGVNVNKKIDINKISNLGQFAGMFSGIDLSCLEGHLHIVKFLLTNGVDFETLSVNVMKEATISGNITLVQYLMSLGFRERLQEEHLVHLLHSTCHFNMRSDFAMTQFYLDLGVNINARNLSGETLFHRACFSDHGQNIKFIKYLITQKSDINLFDDFGFTGFHYACENHNFMLIKFLIQNGVDVNATDTTYGEIGLHLVCFEKPCFDIIHYLVQNGCNVNLHDGNFVTALHLLVKQIPRYKTYQEQNTCRLCILTLIEQGDANVDQELIPSLLRFAIKYRMIEITFMRHQIFQKFNESIAQTITDFTMLPITETSLQTILQIFYHYQ